MDALQSRVVLPFKNDGSFLEAFMAAEQQGSFYTRSTESAAPCLHHSTESSIQQTRTLPPVCGAMQQLQPQQQQQQPCQAQVSSRQQQRPSDTAHTVSREAGWSAQLEHAHCGTIHRSPSPQEAQRQAPQCSQQLPQMHNHQQSEMHNSQQSQEQRHQHAAASIVVHSPARGAPAHIKPKPIMVLRSNVSLVEGALKASGATATASRKRKADDSRPAYLREMDRYNAQACTPDKGDRPLVKCCNRTWCMSESS